MLVEAAWINVCLALAVQYQGRETTTVEGVDHPLQKDVPSAATEHLADTGAELDETEIRERMSGNLCRCCAYNGIVSAIKEVAK